MREAESDGRQAESLAAGTGTRPESKSGSGSESEMGWIEKRTGGYSHLQMAQSRTKLGPLPFPACIVGLGFQLANGLWLARPGVGSYASPCQVPCPTLMHEQVRKGTSSLSSLQRWQVQTAYYLPSTGEVPWYLASCARLRRGRSTAACGCPISCCNTRRELANPTVDSAINTVHVAHEWGLSPVRYWGLWRDSHAATAIVRYSSSGRLSPDKQGRR